MRSNRNEPELLSLVYLRRGGRLNPSTLAINSCYRGVVLPPLGDPPSESNMCGDRWTAAMSLCHLVRLVMMVSQFRPICQTSKSQGPIQSLLPACVRRRSIVRASSAAHGSRAAGRQLGVPPPPLSPPGPRACFRGLFFFWEGRRGLVKFPPPPPSVSPEGGSETGTASHRPALSLLDEL
jgi:hypothetical protein